MEEPPCRLYKVLTNKEETTLLWYPEAKGFFRPRFHLFLTLHLLVTDFRCYTDNLSNDSSYGSSISRVSGRDLVWILDLSQLTLSY